MKTTTFKRLLFSLSLACSLISLQAGIPKGYYDAARGKKGAALKTALSNITYSHKMTGYFGLYKVYEKSDVRDDGRIWDMYSATTNFRVSDYGGTYSKDGDLYNREHSLPQSWFENGGNSSIIKADAYHVIPVDGYVNGRRSNYAYGEVGTIDYQSNQGFSKLGTNKLSGYSGRVFEPNDLYKGDIARSYFYLVTAYEANAASWANHTNGSASFNGSAYPAFTSWTLQMLLRWAGTDKVSTKEINRNEAVYSFQNNRNPFIDFPGLEAYIWGDKQDVPFDPDKFDGGSYDPPTPEAPEAPTFSLPQGTVRRGSTLIIGSGNTSDVIYYSINGGPEQQGASPVSITLSEDMQVVARTFRNELFSDYTVAYYTVTDIVVPEGGTLYQRITAEADLIEGREYIIVCEAQHVAVADISNDVRSFSDVSISSDFTIDTEVGKTGTPYAITLGGTKGAWTLFDPVNKAYLSLESDANKLHNSTSSTAQTSQWTITISSNATAQIANKKYDSRIIQYNKSSPRFATYTSSQQPVQLYMRLVKDDSTLGMTSLTKAPREIFVFSVSGKLIRRATTLDAATKNLSSGLYIVNGQKILVP